MKRLNILPILLILGLDLYSQVFPEPTGMSATDPNEDKIINKCDASTYSGIQAPKTNTVARRYTFGIGIWNELYQIDGRKWGACWPSFSCIDCSTCDVGWNKIGRIEFIRNTYVNNNKLHVGWRADPDNYHVLKMSAYFHEVDWGKEEFPDYFVSHYITSVQTDTEPYVDMYMSLGTIAMIINTSAVVIRKPGMIPDNKQSYLVRTFYFGDGLISDEKNCMTPVTMKVEFRNQHYDWSGFPEQLNTCKYITVNISDFESGDAHTFYAYKEMYGSISDENLDYVQYEDGHPNPVKQKCIISSGADITFSAGEKVILNHGFTAEPGSHFVAKIVQKEKYPGYYDEPKKLNLPPLEQGECNKESIGKDSVNLDHEYADNIQLMNHSSHSLEFFSIYPNPHPGIFTIEWNDETISEFTIQVFNMMGKPVYTRQHAQPGITHVDISGQAKGIYFVKLQAGDKVITERVVYQ